MIQPKITHKKAWLLLPWYTNGTLTTAERRLVEEHLQVCMVCRREQTDIQKLAAHTRQSAVPELCPQASFSRLMQRIDNEPKNSRIKNLHLHSAQRLYRHVLLSLRGFFSPNPLPIMAAMVLLLLFVPIGILVTPSSRESPDASYRTLSASSGLNDSEANDIHVIFAETLDFKERLRALAAIHGEITAGPNAHGLYLVHIAPEQGAKPDIAKAIAALRQDAGVLFAEPAVPPGSSFSVQDD
jgi:hypothetical protein